MHQIWNFELLNEVIFMDVVLMGDFVQWLDKSLKAFGCNVGHSKNKLEFLKFFSNSCVAVVGERRSAE